MQKADEVGGFRCRKLMRLQRVPAQIADKVPKVPVQIAHKVLEGSGADSRQGSGGFWCRKLMRFRRVLVQIADEVLDGSGTHSKQSSEGLRYKNIPRSSKLLGITHGFIFIVPPLTSSPRSLPAPPLSTLPLFICRTVHWRALEHVKTCQRHSTPIRIPSFCWVLLYFNVFYIFVGIVAMRSAMLVLQQQELLTRKPLGYPVLRFGGEGVLVGEHTAALNAQVTFVRKRNAISAVAGGALKCLHRKPELGGACVVLEEFCALEV